MAVIMSLEVQTLQPTVQVAAAIPVLNGALAIPVTTRVYGHRFAMLSGHLFWRSLCQALRIVMSEMYYRELRLDRTR